MLEGKLLAILDRLICLVYKSEEDLSSISKAQPEIRAVSAAPGLCISVCKKGFDHQLAFVTLGLVFPPHLGFLSCIAYILLTALTFICHLAMHEDSEDAHRL